MDTVAVAVLLSEIPVQLQTSYFGVFSEMMVTFMK